MPIKNLERFAPCKNKVSGVSIERGSLNTRRVVLETEFSARMNDGAMCLGCVVGIRLADERVVLSERRVPHSKCALGFFPTRH